MADYLQQVAYNFSLEDRNLPYKQEETLSKLIEIKEKSKLKLRKIRLRKLSTKTEKWTIWTLIKA